MGAQGVKTRANRLRARISCTRCRIRVVGLTGGIASGKSTVTAMLRERGYPVADADQLARDVVAPGEPALQKLVDRFGSGILAADGSLDRRALGRVIFDDDAARTDLNRIVHPAIALRSAQTFANWGREGIELGFYDAALLFETGSYRQFPLVVVVAAPKAMQLQRLLMRDSDLSSSEAEARIASQMPLADKVDRADIVIHNDADLATLRRRVDEALDQIHQRLASPLRGNDHG